jgi:hypothetical protein
MGSTGLTEEEVRIARSWRRRQFLWSWLLLPLILAVCLLLVLTAWDALHRDTPDLLSGSWMLILAVGLPWLWYALFRGGTAYRDVAVGSPVSTLGGIFWVERMGRAARPHVGDTDVHFASHHLRKQVTEGHRCEVRAIPREPVLVVAVVWSDSKPAHPPKGSHKQKRY